MSPREGKEGRGAKTYLGVPALSAARMTRARVSRPTCCGLGWSWAGGDRGSAPGRRAVGADHADVAGFVGGRIGVVQALGLEIRPAVLGAGGAEVADFHPLTLDGVGVGFDFWAHARRRDGE